MPKPGPPSQTAADREALHAALQEAHAGIAARERNPLDGTRVDFEAAASIAIPEHHAIDGALQYFSTTLRDKIQTSLLRSARYRNMIDRVLEEHRLPRALAYLPVIESAYIPTLTSRVGAHGIWQFMPETARDYGLRVDWWVDERADPELSTRAAAEFLRDLHRQFDGDWSLILAAYNCGPGRVRRTLQRTGASTFWELLEMKALPKETRGYVPTFYATLRIAGDPEAHGFRLDAPVDAGERSIEIDGPVSLTYLAEAASVDVKELRDLNPSLHRGLVPPGRTAVRVPARAAAAVAEVASNVKEDDSHIAVAAFTVRKGDTVTKLARRLGTTPDTIREMNGLRSQDSLRAGRSIYLPVNARRLGALLRHAEDEDIFYTVRKGDTLYAIAKKHKLSVGDLRELNDLPAKAILKPGQKLRVTPPRGLTAGGM
ncbi:MAG TPA: LysM peptidoglycan-binding domain-containing protein [Thermoanaerobaculia bacterium]|nr:LysM peptidoglycan-binding domain-containing protein [Thermoanaerobaculia bacterium]